MKLATLLIGSCACLAHLGSSKPTEAHGDKIIPFVQTLTGVATSIESLQKAIKGWDGTPLGGIDIMGNSTEVTNQLKEGIKRIQGAKRLHASSEIKLAPHARRAAKATLGSLQHMTDRFRNFAENMARPSVYNNLKEHKQLSASLSDEMSNKFGPIARRLTQKGKKKSQMWFDEAIEIYAPKKHKRPEEDKKRRAEHPNWPHIQPPKGVEDIPDYEIDD